jgi:hypothetical protein
MHPRKGQTKPAVLLLRRRRNKYLIWMAISMITSPVQRNGTVTLTQAQAQAVAALAILLEK